VASELLEEHGIRGPDDLDIEALAEVYADVVDKPLESCEGRLVCGSGRPRIVVSSHIQHAGKRRFVVAHELGHYFQEDRRSQLRLCTEDSLLSDYSKDPQEKEANIFAGELLMPAPWVAPIFRTAGRRPSFDQVEEVAELFTTSLTSAAIRFIELSVEPLALVVAQAGKILWHVKTADFRPYWLHGLGSTISSSTYAADAFVGRQLPNKMQRVPAEAWLDMQSLRDDAEIFEHSRWLGPRLNMTLSLLWVDEDPRAHYGSDDDW
jgi:hypothetical protein